MPWPHANACDRMLYPPLRNRLHVARAESAETLRGTNDEVHAWKIVIYSTAPVHDRAVATA
jgi:hypothetical protein